MAPTGGVKDQPANSPVLYTVRPSCLAVRWYHAHARDRRPINGAGAVVGTDERSESSVVNTKHMAPPRRAQSNRKCGCNRKPSRKIERVDNAIETQQEHKQQSSHTRVRHGVHQRRKTKTKQGPKTKQKNTLLHAPPKKSNPSQPPPRSRPKADPPPHPRVDAAGLKMRRRRASRRSVPKIRGGKGAHPPWGRRGGCGGTGDRQNTNAPCVTAQVETGGGTGGGRHRCGGSRRPRNRKSNNKKRGRGINTANRRRRCYRQARGRVPRRR